MAGLVDVADGPGAVLSLRLPAGWVAEPPVEVMGGRELVKYSAPARPQVCFCSMTLAFPLSRRGGEAFERCLYSEFHQLTDVEFGSLRELLEGMSNAGGFAVDECYTCYLNSRRVLKVRGRWLKTGETTICCFVDCSGDGRIVQHLFFSGPTVDFEHWSDTADAIFLSINWRR